MTDGRDLELAWLRCFYWGSFALAQLYIAINYHAVVGVSIALGWDGWLVRIVGLSLYSKPGRWPFPYGEANAVNYS